MRKEEAFQILLNDMQKISKESNIKSQMHKQNDSNGSPNKVVWIGKNSEQTSPIIQKKFPLPENPPKSTHNHQA